MRAGGPFCLELSRLLKIIRYVIVRASLGHSLRHPTAGASSARIVTPTAQHQIFHFTRVHQQDLLLVNISYARLLHYAKMVGTISLNLTYF